jgi:VWA domain containing CoxE-like protein
MRFPLEHREGIPTGERRALRRPVFRTGLLRALLALSLLGALALAYVLARNDDVRYAPLLPSDTTGVVVLDLSGSVGDFRKIGQTFRRLAEEDERTGLVVFSDAAYELVPPGSPGRELQSLVRLFTPLREGGNVYPVNAWDAAEFRGGTRISAGLQVAREALAREGVTRGSVLLVSDLDVTQDAEEVSQALVALRRGGIGLRIVPLSPLPEHLAFFEQLVARSAFLSEADAGASVATPEERRLGGALPWEFMLVAALLVVLLSVNERFLARLEVRP